MLDTLPDELINHVLSFCTPVDRYELKCINKLLHAAHSRLYPELPHYLIKPDVGKLSISFTNWRIVIDRIETLDMPERYIDAIINSLIHNDKYIQLYRERERFPYSANKIYGEKHVLSRILLRMSGVLSNYINKLCSNPTTEYSTDLEKYIDLYSCNSEYAEFLISMVPNMKRNSGNPDYIRKFIIHLPASIKDISILLILQHVPAVIYATSDYYLSYYNTKTNTESDAENIKNIKYINPNHMHCIDDAANILVHNYKYEVQPLTILDVADQLDKSSEEVIRDVLESISISAIKIKLNNIYKYKYTYIENRYRRSYFRKEMHPRDYYPHSGPFRILP